MMDSATVVWLAEGTARAAAPSEDAKRALEAWARARGVRLESPADLGAPALAIDWSAGETVERGIERAREALAGLDFDAAERELARAEAVLRDHAELPQAAWLLAEVQRAWSSRWLRGNDEPRARRAWQRAAALDGGRQPGLGEKAFEPDPPIAATIHIEREGALRLDGSAIAPGEVKQAEGEHALAIVRPDGAATWAAWVSLAPGARVRVTGPAAVPCSSDDVLPARAENGAVRAAGVRCARWVAAIAGDAGKASVVRIAACEAESCGPFVEWRSFDSTASGWTFEPGLASAESHSGWPAWAIWTIAGLGVAGAAVAVVVATGALKSSPTETRFANGGLQIHSF